MIAMNESRALDGSTQKTGVQYALFDWLVPTQQNNIKVLLLMLVLTAKAGEEHGINVDIQDSSSASESAIGVSSIWLPLGHYLTRLKKQRDQNDRAT
jgi:hypothetical protein